MALKDKLRELRTARNMTQEKVAEQLGISSQSVSKWERGLLSPDISLLPKIAMLYRCSIDQLFEMDIRWGSEHKKEFKEKIRVLHTKSDYEGIYQTWIEEIELNPDCYENYPDVMNHVLRKKMFDDDRIRRMISLADHAEKYCSNSDILNDIYRIILQICAQSKNPKIKEKSNYYYKKLPLLKNSREIHAKYVIDGDEYNIQTKRNIIYSVSLAECAIRQLIFPQTPIDKKLYYYIKAAHLYETVLDEKYAGIWDVPLLQDYAEIISLFIQTDKINQANDYMDRFFSVLEKHLDRQGKQITSDFIYDTVIPNFTPAGENCKKILQNMLNDPYLNIYKEQIANFYKKYNEHFPTTGGNQNEN